MNYVDPTSTTAWQELLAHRQQMKSLHLRDLLTDNPQRVDRFTIHDPDLILDYSKNLISEPVMASLVNLARQCHLQESIQRMFSGERINETEDRAVLHTVLRNQTKEPVYVNEQDIKPQVRDNIAKMEGITHQIMQKKWRGFSGRPIRHIVHIGIGGSMLGPRMVCRALQFYSSREVEVHFVANLDSAEFAEGMAGLDIEETLFIVVSKTFTTLETLNNAQLARAVILNHFKQPSALSRHMLAVTANHGAAREAFGLPEENILTMWDWVGGRFSLSSAAGLSIMLTIGPDHFHQFLKGLSMMDDHFQQTPLENNMPVILALLGIWYRNFFHTHSQAILPYSHYLKYFPAYLQALEMESNGKENDRRGRPTSYQTSPVVWGDVGTNGQHAFFQALHQGSQWIPCDFIGILQPLHPDRDTHKKVLANLIAQAECLALGNSPGTPDQAAEDPFRRFAGNRPSNMLLLEKLTPLSLGKLVSLYEHKVFCQGIIWNLFSFDQWGVELGKQMAQRIYSELEPKDKTSNRSHDSSTSRLIQRIGEGTKLPGEPKSQK